MHVCFLISEDPRRAKVMRLEGTCVFAAPRADVWAALMDPTALAGALPGGETMLLFVVLVRLVQRD
jgi:hypothetical protein